MRLLYELGLRAALRVYSFLIPIVSQWKYIYLRSKSLIVDGSSAIQLHLKHIHGVSTSAVEVRELRSKQHLMDR
jgi:hypothetical protein